MSVVEADALKLAARNVLRDVAKHANSLAVGLQNAAPPQEAAKPNLSVQYLNEIAVYLKDLSEDIEATGEASSDE